MFGRKTIEKKEYDRENLRPLLRCSICTGEQVAGFKNRHTGKFDADPQPERFGSVYGNVWN